MLSFPQPNQNLIQQQLISSLELPREINMDSPQGESLTLPKPFTLLEVARAVKFEHSVDVGCIRPIDETVATEWLKKEFSSALDIFDRNERNRKGPEISRAWYGDFYDPSCQDEPGSLIQVSLEAAAELVRFRVSTVNSQWMIVQYLAQEELEALLRKDSLKLAPLDDLVSQYNSLVAEFRLEHFKDLPANYLELREGELSPFDLVTRDVDLMKRVSWLIDEEEIAASDTYTKLSEIVSILTGRVDEICTSNDLTVQKRLRSASADIQSLVSRVQLDTSDLGFAGKIIARMLIKAESVLIKRHGMRLGELENRIEAIDSYSDLLKAARLFLVLSSASK
jgi:hypothetical protein